MLKVILFLPRAIYRMFQYYRLENEPNTLYPLLEKHVRTEKYMVLAYENLNRRYLDKERFNDAIELTNWRMKQKPSASYYFKYQLGRISLGMNDFSKAAQYFQEGLDEFLEVKSPRKIALLDFYNGLARAHYGMENFDETELYCRDVIDLYGAEKRNRPRWLAWFARKDADEIFRVLEQTQDTGTLAYAHQMLAYVYHQKQDQDGWLEHLKKAAGVNCYDSRYKKLYGTALYNAKRFEEGLNVYKQYLDEFPDDIELVFETSRCYYMMREWDAGIAFIEPYLKINPEDDKLHLGLGALYAGNGQFELARNEYQELLRLESTGAGRLLSTIEEFEKRSNQDC
ncbi:MAG: hypothetical protein COA73_15495 [Candidatus Hydrogenedentota bacterium]|nr:MAG: hypothetical protein COA73_15495 [Candidatus Hydrogenedentota bacterium]